MNKKEAHSFLVDDFLNKMYVWVTFTTQGCCVTEELEQQQVELVCFSELHCRKRHVALQYLLK